MELPPLGRLSAATHAAPMQLKATVLAVDVDAVQLTTRGDDPIALLESSITDDLAPALTWFAWRTLALSALAGAVGALLLPGRHWWTAAAGAAGGAMAVGLLLAATWAPYDRAAFDEPTFHGELERVPVLLDAAERNLGELEQVRGASTRCRTAWRACTPPAPESSPARAQETPPSCT